MRLSGRTLIFAAVLIVLIGLGLLVLNPGDEAADTPDETVVEENVTLFADLEASAVTRVRFTGAVEEDVDNAETVYVRDTGGAWTLSTELSSNIALTESDVTLVQADIENAVNTLVGLVSTEQFESDDLAQFGLDPAQVTVELVTEDDTFMVQLGNTNPNGTRYYALLGENVREALGVESAQTVFLLTNKTQIDSLLGISETPPLAPTPTAAPTATPAPSLSFPGPLFVDPIAVGSTTELEVRDNETDEVVRIVRESLSASWDVVEAADLDEPVAADSELMTIITTTLFSLNAVDSLPADNLEALGLDEPRFTIATNSGDEITTLQIGGTDVSGTRTYVLVDDFEQVAVVPEEDISFLTSVVAAPPFLVQIEEREEETAEATAEVTEAVTSEATEEATEQAD